MTFEDRILDLKKIHEDFVKNDYFSAFSLMTPKQDWVSINKNESDIKAIITNAMEKKIFNVVVEEKGKAIGSINIKDLKNKNWHNSIKSVEEYHIDAFTELPELSEIMVKDSKHFSREDSPLYFVVNSKDIKKEPVGIMTFWDLNRAPSYIFSYIALVYLEHTLQLKIMESHQQYFDHSDLINKVPKSSYFKCIKEFFSTDIKSYNHVALSDFGLKQLLFVYNLDPHIDKSDSKDLEDLSKLFSGNPKFRNRIGHSVKLLISDDKNFVDDLEFLNNIWKYGERAFIKFPDPKISLSSPVVSHNMNQ